MQVDVLQDAQVAAQRLEVDARRPSRPSDGSRVAARPRRARDPAGSRGWSCRRPRSSARPSAAATRRPAGSPGRSGTRGAGTDSAPSGITDSERTPTLRNVSSPTSSGNGRSGTDSAGSASSASALMRKPRVGHQPVVHAQPLDVGRQAADGRAQADAADGLVGAGDAHQRLGVGGVAQVVVDAGVDARVHLAREADRAAARADVAEAHGLLLQVVERDVEAEQRAEEAPIEERQVAAQQRRAVGEVGG